VHYFVSINSFIAYSPQIIQHPTDQTAEVYTSASFECKAKRYGNVEIHWQRDGTLRLPASTSVTTNMSYELITSTLKIDKIISFYKGGYYCLVKNEIGVAKSSFAYLNVSGK